MEFMEWTDEKFKILTLYSFKIELSLLAFTLISIKFFVLVFIYFIYLGAPHKQDKRNIFYVCVCLCTIDFQIVVDF